MVIQIKDEKIPKEWRFERLSEIIDLKNGYSFKSEYFVDISEQIVITPGNFHREQKLYFEERNTTFYKGPVPVGFILNNDDLLIVMTDLTRDGVILGNAVMLQSEFVVLHNQRIGKVLFKQKIDHVFLKYFLNSNFYKKQIKQTSAGTGVIHTSKNKILEIMILIPRKNEQKSISESLSDIEIIIEQFEKLIKKKKNIRQGAMQELLTGKTRLKGFEQKWITKKLENLTNITMGQSPESKYYNKKGKGLPLIQGNADIQNRKTISRIFTTMYPKKGKIGDTIMSVRAPVGEIAKSTLDCCLGRGVCAISYQNEYVYHYMVFIESKWTSLSTGSTFDSINSKEVNNIKLFIPKSQKEQTTIANILSDMDSEIKELEVIRDKYIMIKQGMMQKLLTGEIRLT